MNNKIILEDKALKNSVWYSLLLSVVGIAAGLLLTSSYILFDGIYSLVGFILGILNWKISAFVKKDDETRFPFGKASIESAVIFLQYVVITFFLIQSLATAVKTVVRGPEPLNIAIITIYIAIQTVFVIWCYVVTERINKKIFSPLVEAVSHQWKIASIIGVSVSIAFVIAWILSALGQDYVALFVDPIILILVVLLLLPEHVREIVISAREMIGMNAEDDLEEADEVISIVNAFGEKINVRRTYCRVSRSSGQLFIEIDFLVEPGFSYDSIREQDQLREALLKELSFIKLDLWMIVAFTHNEKWAT